MNDDKTDAIAKIIARLEAEGFDIHVELKTTYSTKGALRETHAFVSRDASETITGSANNWGESWDARYHGHDFDAHSLDEIERVVNKALRKHKDTIDKMAATVAAEGRL